MATDPDPYRTLGLPRSASLDDVRRAYRRLVKANHPDAAGEAALPRFLAIQAAYDQITGYGSGDTGGPRRTAPRQPWDADPTRADATRRAYGGRSRRTRAGESRTRGSGTSGTSGTTGSTGTTGRQGSGPSTGSGGTGSAAGTGGRAGRPPNKATLGSTSYDGAEDQPFEPDWGGASWYGTTSGTYWTLNPKEYADPRKHGPEYQARARRAAASKRGAADGSTTGGPATNGPDVMAPDLDPAATHTEATGAAADAGATADAGPAASVDAAAQRPRPTHTTSSWWDATAAETPAPGAETVPPTGPAPRATWSGVPPATPGATPGSVPAPAGPAAGLVATWLDPAATGLPIRVGRAVVGWAPIALGIGWLVGELSGCSRFAATCEPAASPIAWVAQLGVLVALVLVPRLAVMAFLATLAVLAAAVPAALILTATGRSSIGGEAQAAPTAGPPVLGGILVIAWLAGLGAGIVRELRRAGILDPGDAARPGASGGPVS